MASEPESSSAETIFEPVSAAGYSSGEDGRFVAGTILAGRYRILGLLGKGGMGEVYRATDLTLGQSVALKFLPQAAAQNPNFLERFHGEVRVARQVSHPNVCRVYDIGEAEGMPFISMEYVDGEDLASLLQRIGRLPAEKAIETARKICAGLAAAHSKGVIHRDLKPQNIMLNKRGEVLIMDFGLAAAADQVSGAEVRNGTPAYMSPEQLKGIEVTTRSDIYSLGLILHELFMGKRPYAASSIPELIKLQESTRLGSMTTLAADIDPAVESTIRACLSADPAHRPASALGVSAALPGGDPLAAALAAGETPSPELVASASANIGMPRRYAILCFAFIVICTLAAPFLKQKKYAINYAPHEFPPDVLQQKARDIAVSLGYPAKPLDSIQRLGRRGGLVSHLNGVPKPWNWPAWIASESPLNFWIRESPKWLIEYPTGEEISDESPAPIVPGMVEMELDGHGRLRNFSAVPYLKQPGVQIPIEAVFQAAQLDFSKFSELTPTGLPRAASDQFRAFRGPHPVLPKTDLTIEIASWRGQITEANFYWPWTRTAASPPVAPSLVVQVRQVLQWIGIVCGVVFAIYLARHNWTLGRADLNGALRLGTIRCGMGMIAWICMVHAVPTSDTIYYLFHAFGNQFFYGAILWLLYIALEPFLRARWPHSIVTWNRALAGRFSDAKLSADILIGCAVGCGIWIFFLARDLFALADEGPGLAGIGLMLHGTRNFIAAIAIRINECLSLGLFGFFIIFGLRTLLRRDWLAAIVGAGIFTLFEGGLASSTNFLLAFSIFFVIYSALLFLLLRFGLVATMAALFFTNFIGASALGTDLTTWYAPSGIVIFGMQIGFAGLLLHFILTKKSELRTFAFVNIANL